MAAARSHAAGLIFQRRPSCFTWIRLYDTNSLRHAAVLPILYTKQVRQIYGSAVFPHNPNSMNKANADLGALSPEGLDPSQNQAGSEAPRPREAVRRRRTSGEAGSVPVGNANEAAVKAAGGV